MKLVGAEWRPHSNFLHIKCDCGELIVHPANRWEVKCDSCGAFVNLADLRSDYLKRAQDLITLAMREKNEA